MKKNTTTARIPLALILVMTIGMGTAWAEEEPVAQEPPAKEAAVDAVSAPTWTIGIGGMRTDDLQTYQVREMMDEQGLARSVTVTEREEEVEYTGVPLSAVLGIVDGVDYEDPWSFDADLWAAGYDVTITASDGYAATFNTTEFGPEEILFAMTRNGEAVYPRVSGDVRKGLWVKDVVSIEAALGASEADEARLAFEFTLTANGEENTWSLADLAATPLYTTAPGSYTTSAGETHGGVYGGVLLKDFLEQFVVIEPDTSVTFVATDGYEMTYGGDLILDESDGRWILAFEQDGEPLPMDPGYIRTIKVGPDTPNIDGHLSVRMIGEIVVEGEAFEDFSLEITGAMDNVLDRTTLQSNMAFSGRTVTFTKREESNEYTGIPLHVLMSFSDDPLYAPHRQDSSIDPYNAEAAAAGYSVTIIASDGFSVTLDSRELHENDDVILALKKNGVVLPDNEWPLIVVWDENADIVPEGIKNVRNVVRIELDM